MTLTEERLKEIENGFALLDEELHRTAFVIPVDDTKELLRGYREYLRMEEVIAVMQKACEEMEKIVAKHEALRE